VAKLGVDPAFWRGRRVFITGHTGFKGGWLSLWLQDMGADLHGFALPPITTPSLFDLASVGDGMSHTLGDLRDLKAVTHALRRAHPEILLHLAAQPLVRQSYTDPVATFATNVMGTVHVLEAARQLNQEWQKQHLPTIRAVLVVTSDKCYANKAWPWPYRESDELAGLDPYSSSKACAEIVTAAYRSSYFAAAVDPLLTVASARAGNVIGGGDWGQDRLVPDAIRAFERGEPLLVRYPAAVRPWQHVLEPLEGYLMLAERLLTDGVNYAGAWNFGPDYDSEQPVRCLVELLARIWGKGARWEVDGRPQPHEAKVLRLDSTKARTLLHWRPRLSLREAIELTMEWYLAAQKRNDPLRDLTLRQVRSFAGAAHA
jgi:CDP-glucose 4,6-dehydratase